MGHPGTMTTPGFSCGELVQITAIAKPATIDAIMIENTNVTYRVIWWVDGDRKLVWVASHELEKT